jgi:hypothetical protein
MGCTSPGLATEERRERLHDGRVEARAGLAAEAVDRLLDRHRGAPGALCGHRAEGVADGDDARAQGDRLALQPVGVAATVVAAAG